PKCGTENPEGAKFCSKCGAELGAAPAPSETSEASTNLQPNIAGLLCYVALWVTGIVFVVIEKKSTFVKFHAWQSIMTFGILTGILFIVSPVFSRIAVATFSPGLLVASGVLSTILWILGLILWIILLIQAGSGKMWKVPLVGDWAEKQASKVS
ncbi:unnamed protein product, partial [marine sediment metagenome]